METYLTALRLQSIHDDGLVWPSKIQKPSVVAGDTGQLAFFEYCLQVPANRLGNAYFSVTQLKVMQEVITLVVFAGFSAVYFKESFKWNHLVGFFCLVAAVFFVFKKW